MTQIKSFTMPCPTCPWRKDATPGGVDIPNFDIKNARALSCTVGEGDDFRQVMACHYTTDEVIRVCVGYVATVGYSNINVRLMASKGTIDLVAINRDCAEIDLYPSFDEMLASVEQVNDERR